MNLKIIKEKIDAIALFVSLLAIIITITGLVKAGPEVSEKMSLYLLLSWVSLVFFNYFFIKTIIKKNNDIEEFIRKLTNDSLLQIKKIKKDKKIPSDVQFIYRYSDYKGIIDNEEFIVLSIVLAWFPIIGILGVMNNESIGFVAFAIVLLFIYIACLFAVTYDHLSEVQNKTENYFNIIEEKIKELRDEL